ncbi:MAG: fatty acid desaturase [Gammaproteobacteria bacterium]|nr:fatty acid desaturase [Gammaproteobacteria bacterium]
MSEDSAVSGGIDPNKADTPQYIQPSIKNALPHYLPLGIFPLLLLAVIHGGWWLLPAFLFMSVAGPLDKVLGLDGRNMDPAKTPERRLLWHNLPVWTWAFLWPPTLIFGMWQILVANPFAIWEDVVLVILMTMEAQAVFVVGHELIHRRTTWERRIGEFLLASASYPQYATEHLYIHHAKVGTPHDVGSAPKGESFWRYFPREVASNLTHSWKSAAERLARRRLPVWHYSNQFWRYGIFVAFWYGLVFWMGGIWAVPVFAFLGLSCVFSMKISNYFQHYGLRRVRLPNGRWEKVMPRHSWSADWKFSNWMFFNMQRHADHHAMASRHYPLLQVRDSADSPELPGTYADMMNIVLRPKRWFEKMDPLVDQWREHFYPEIDDWSAYDSPITAARPDAFEAIVEIFGTAPRLAKWIERHSELLDNLQDREFTDLDLPKGFGPDEESESIARRGLARLYWTHEMGVPEMKDLIAELPTADAKDSAEIVRNWSNDKAFQIGMHVLRGNLSPAEAKTALSNLAEASICTVLAAVVADFVERVGHLHRHGVAAMFLGDLASQEAYPGVEIHMLFVHDGLRFGENERLCRRFREALTDLAQDSLLFSPIRPDGDLPLALPLSELAESCSNPPFDQIAVVARARCVFECGDSGIGTRVHEAWRQVVAQWSADETLVARLRQPLSGSVEGSVSTYAQVRGGLADIERAARLLQLTDADAGRDELAPTASQVFNDAGDESLAQAAAMWRDLQGITRLIGEEGFDAAAAGPKVKSLLAGAWGHEDFETLEAAVAETATRAAAQIDTLVSRT